MYVCMCLTSRHCLYLAVARSEGGKKTGRLKLRRLDFRSSVHTNFGKFAVASEFGEHRGNVVDSQCSPHGMSPPPLSLGQPSAGVHIHCVLSLQGFSCVEKA